LTSAIPHHVTSLFVDHRAFLRVDNDAAVVCHRKCVMLLASSCREPSPYPFAPISALLYFLSPPIYSITLIATLTLTIMFHNTHACIEQRVRHHRYIGLPYSVDMGCTDTGGYDTTGSRKCGRSSGPTSKQYLLPLPLCVNMPTSLLVLYSWIYIFRIFFGSKSLKIP
jgi:hypothetical protein